jgi:DNA replication and repair protein RecF
LLKQPSVSWREVLAFDQPLIDAGTRISEARARLVADLLSPAHESHHAISHSRELLALRYVRGGTDDFAGALAAARKEDSRLRQTTVGPHRDDVALLLNDHPAEIASEGQQRTLVLALRLGAARLLATHFQSPPVLLIDDIFGELDPSRRNALLDALPADSQKIITTTYLDWMEELQPQILRV